MKQGVIICTLGIGLAVGAGALWFANALPHTPSIATSVQQEKTSQPTPMPAQSSIAGVSDSKTGEPLTREQIDLLNNPKTIQLSQRLEFQQRLNDFVASAESLDPQARKTQASELETTLSGYEKAGEVSANEGLIVRVALVKASTADAAEQQDAIDRLMAQYEADAEKKQAAWRVQPKPEFDAYKATETRIVNEVMALETIPEDKSRNDYLRERLMEARIEAERQNREP
ncbi:hypothetical protein [Marinobacter sp. BGYM27]|uniref:hypothetical protein n=1 Tax=Marinobacter sp. BGYM27 TaxID=2975597 RepID=UPI0021A7A325|nr:hypothetical protein [Marinobacter sp. BGYM27]MDG5500722.1 hypothetical protein [Marinobacter sp. BGYM27]